MGRLQAGIGESFETSRMHEEILRTLKNANTASVIIDNSIAVRSGDLLSRRFSKKARSDWKKGSCLENIRTRNLYAQFEDRSHRGKFKFVMSLRS